MGLTLFLQRLTIGSAAIAASLVADIVHGVMLKLLTTRCDPLPGVRAEIVSQFPIVSPFGMCGLGDFIPGRGLTSKNCGKGGLLRNDKKNPMHPSRQPIRIEEQSYVQRFFVTAVFNASAGNPE